jgi:hypothetical protein
MPSPSRYYSATAAKTTLSSAIDSSSSSLQLASATNLPAQYPFTLILEKDTANEEIVEVTGLVGSSYQITRNIDNSGAKSHGIGAIVEHGVSARDFADSRSHEVATGGTHGVVGDFVGTQGTQTITGAKTFTSAIFAGATGTFLTPTITSFVNATHSHQNAAGGGQLAIAAVNNLQSSLDLKAPSVHTHGLDARNIMDHGVVVTQRGNLNFTGSLVVTDDSANDKTDVTVTVPDTSGPIKILSLMGAI